MTGGKRCILIADDEPRITRALRDFLGAKKYSVIEAYSGDEALAAFNSRSSTIDLVLLDVMMPGLDGFEVLTELRKTSLVPVIMLTAKSQEYDQVAGFERGADDYIVKPFSPTLLLARIEAVLKRAGKGADGDEVKMCGLTLSTARRTAIMNGEEIALTRREFDLVYYLVVNSGLALTREQILNAVWGYDFEGDPRTVDTHVKQLRGKLGDFGAHIRTIHSVGYRLDE